MIAEKEIRLSTLLDVIWERGKKIAIFTLICMILAAAASMTIANRYKAEAVLFMSKSKLGERTMQNPSIPMGTYQDLFFHPEVYQKVIEGHALQNPPYNMKYPQDLSDRVKVKYIEDTSLITISSEMEDPQLAADVSNDLATEAVQLNEKLVSMEMKTSSSMIAEQSQKMLDQVKTYRDKYLKSLKQNLKPVKIQNLSVLQSVYAALMQEKENLDGSIAELEERKKSFETIFSATDTDFRQTIITRRSILTDPLVEQSVVDRLGDRVDLDSIKNLMFVDEQVNDNYNQLKMEYLKLLTDLPGQIEKRRVSVQRIKEITPQIDALQKEVFDLDVDELLVKGDLDRALEIFAGINKEVGWAGTTVASERQDLVVVHSAIPVGKKVYPRRSLIVLLSGLSAFLLSFLYFLLVDLYGLMIYQSRKEDVVPSNDSV